MVERRHEGHQVIARLFLDCEVEGFFSNGDVPEAVHVHTSQRRGPGVWFEADDCSPTLRESPDERAGSAPNVKNRGRSTHPPCMPEHERRVRVVVGPGMPIAEPPQLRKQPHPRLAHGRSVSATETEAPAHDLACAGDDLDGLERQAEHCGADTAPDQPNARWVVMLDPAGYRFRLTPFTRWCPTAREAQRSSRSRNAGTLARRRRSPPSRTDRHCPRSHAGSRRSARRR